MYFTDSALKKVNERKCIIAENVIWLIQTFSNYYCVCRQNVKYEDEIYQKNLVGRSKRSLK